jgi:hypothetical protein
VAHERNTGKFVLAGQDRGAPALRHNHVARVSTVARGAGASARDCGCGERGRDTGLWTVQKETGTMVTWSIIILAIAMPIIHWIDFIEGVGARIRNEPRSVCRHKNGPKHDNFTRGWYYADENAWWL